MAKNLCCLVVVRTETGTLHGGPAYFKLPGVLTGRVDRSAGDNIVRSAEVRFSFQDDTVYVPASAILEPGPYGGLFPIEKFIGDELCPICEGTGSAYGGDCVCVPD
jgi:hypothetical protein